MPPHPPVEIGTRPQLFVDDYLVASSVGLSERLHAVNKHPEPVLKAEASWEDPGIGAIWGSPNVRYNPTEKQFKLWYSAYGTYPARDRNEDPRRNCIATSTDGIHWDRPNLGLVEWQGSKANNIFSIGSDFGPHHGMVDGVEIGYTDEPPDMRFKSPGHGGRTPTGEYGHGVMFSPDGLNWRQFEGNPVFSSRNHGDVISGTSLRDWFDPANSPKWPAGRYALFPKIHTVLGPFRQRRSCGMALEDPAEGSPPYTRWMQPVLVLAPDELDDEMAEDRLAKVKSILAWDEPEDHRTEFYGIQVFRVGDVFLGMVWVYDAAFEYSRLGKGNQYAIVEVQLVASRDLLHWRRVGGRQPVIPRGPLTAFDSHMIFYHSLPVQVGDEWWIYYQGFNEGHGSRHPYSEDQRKAYWEAVKAGRRHLPSIGLGRVRREGFVSLEAGLAGGTLTTRAVQAGGAGLELNVAVHAGGEARVAVVDENGGALSGFAASDCTPITADAVRVPVRWGAKPGDPAWRTRPVRVVFHLKNADLYGFRFV